jgi:transcriptional regulator with XRE-family HTH domain
MARTTAPILPRLERRLAALGERLRAGRRRRELTEAMVAERAGMSRTTLRGIEEGRPGATMGAYAAVLQVLGFEQDLDVIAASDPLGRDLQDANLKQRQRPKKR